MATRTGKRRRLRSIGELMAGPRPHLRLVPPPSLEQTRAFREREAARWDGRLIQTCIPYLFVARGGRSHDAARRGVRGKR